MDYRLGIENSSPSVLIAEIGLNHNGSLDLAKTMVAAAASSGATVAKFQTYLASERVARDHNLFDLLESCELSVADWLDLKRVCDDEGITFLSTAFGLRSLELLREIGMMEVKISSFSLTDLGLLEAAIEKRFSLLVSTGASSWDEITQCNTLLLEGGANFAFLHCISSYPVASEKDLHLSNITRLKTLTGRRVGFSDHSEGPEAFFWAALVGATIFEKHFTTDNSLVGPDQKMSANPEVFRRAVDNVARAFDVLGESRAAPFVSEMGAIPMRTRS